MDPVLQVTLWGLCHTMYPLLSSYFTHKIGPRISISSFQAHVYFVMELHRFPTSLNQLHIPLLFLYSTFLNQRVNRHDSEVLTVIQVFFTPYYALNNTPGLIVSKNERNRNGWLKFFPQFSQYKDRNLHNKACKSISCIVNIVLFFAEKCINCIYFLLYSYYLFLFKFKYQTECIDISWR